MWKCAHDIIFLHWSLLWPNTERTHIFKYLAKFLTSSTGGSNISVRGCQPQWLWGCGGGGSIYYSTKFSWKLHENEEKLDRMGAYAKFVCVDPPLSRILKYWLLTLTNFVQVTPLWPQGIFFTLTAHRLLPSAIIMNCVLNVKEYIRQQFLLRGLWIRICFTIIEMLTFSLWWCYK